MKTLLNIALLLILPIYHVFGQELGTYNPWNHAASFYHPALTGLEETKHLKLTHRSQWLGSDNAPQQELLSYESRLYKRYTDTIAQTALPTHRNRLYNSGAKVIKRKKDLKAGLGAYMSLDNYGPSSQLLGQISVSKKLSLKLNRRLKIKGAFGIKAAYRQFSFNRNKISVLNELDPSYLDAINGAFNYSSFRLGVGAALFKSSYYLAYSADGVFNVSLQGEEPFPFEMQHLINGAYAHNTEFIEYMIYSAMMVSAQRPSNIGLGLKARYQEKYVADIFLRPVRGYAIRFGVQLWQRLMLNYSYEIAPGPLQRATFGSHEVGFILLFSVDNGLKWFW